MARLIEGFGSLEMAWRASSSALASACSCSDHLLRAIESYRREWGPNPVLKADQLWNRGRRVLLPGDPCWPTALDQAHPAPAALYWSGRGSVWGHLRARRAVAVVGTRRPSRHGVNVSRQIGAVLAQAGWPVVSGLAAGIDGSVHQGCLQHQGVPIGVLGTPLERIYPREHAQLQASVGEQGLLLTELPAGASVSKGSFALRNRLLVALTCAVILVECPQGSGALHSAELAWEEGLPLWVVPADTGRASAEGSNELLARGATPLTRPEDLLRWLGPGPLKPPSVVREQEALSGEAPGAAWVDRLLAALGRGASMEDLCEAMDCSCQDLLPHLLDLEASGAVVVEPGLFWRAC